MDHEFDESSANDALIAERNALRRRVAELESQQASAGSDALLAQTELRLQRLAALRAVEMAVNSSLDLRVTLEVLVDQVFSHLKVDAAAVLLFNRADQTLEFSAGRGFNTNDLHQSYLRLGHGLASRSILQRQAVFIPDLAEITQDFARANMVAGEQFVAYFAAPMLAKGDVVGVLEIFQRSPLSFDREWQDFVESMAAQAAIAIDNARLFESLQRTNLELSMAYDATLEGWVKALELRDAETEGHTQRVIQATIDLARQFGMNGDQLVHIRRGALLHDIGKMGIPDQILRKPGPLSKAEWEVMCQHPTYAYQLLAPIPFLRGALDIPYAHHERWDGSGYPRRLAGEQIPLAARIFAVVDVWDALRSDRPYRRGYTDAAVHQYLREHSGSLFDPQVVEVFLKSFFTPATTP